ncbi:probable rRNA maturation factor [Lachnospiraceae bacterium]|nr:probable rRNA maturation factor [Lachnospiraceae bacterium]
MTFYIEKETETELGIPYEEIYHEVALEVLNQEGCPYEVEVSLTLVDPHDIQETNREFRGIDRVTDVLSFPMIDYDEPGDFSQVEERFSDCFNPETGELMLGDIVICLDRAKEQAEEYGHSVKREFAFLIAHSMLHLLGFDHMEDEEARVMEAKQRQALDHLGITR